MAQDAFFFIIKITNMRKAKAKFTFLRKRETYMLTILVQDNNRKLAGRNYKSREAKYLSCSVTKLGGF